MTQSFSRYSGAKSRKCNNVKLAGERRKPVHPQVTLHLWLLLLSNLKIAALKVLSFWRLHIFNLVQDLSEIMFREVINGFDVVKENIFPSVWKCNVQLRLLQCPVHIFHRSVGNFCKIG